MVEPIANISVLAGARFWLATASSPFPGDQLNLTGAIRITFPAADHVSVRSLLPAILLCLIQISARFDFGHYTLYSRSQYTLS